jgi:hypothetical protein
MGPILRFVSALVCILAVGLIVAAPAEAGGFFARQAFVAPVVVPQAFVAQRVVVPRQRFVLAPQAIVVPQAFSVQRLVVPQTFVAPVQGFSVGGGCGALFFSQ